MSLIGVSGGIDSGDGPEDFEGALPGSFFGGARGSGEDPDLEVLGEYRLHVLSFRGLDRETVVDGSSFPEPRSIRGFIKGFARAVIARPGRGLASTPLKKFLDEHPHPPEKRSPYCESNERSRDYRLGAEVCGYCRDRLAVCESLLVAAAVRVVPTR